MLRRKMHVPDKAPPFPGRLERQWTVIRDPDQKVPWSGSIEARRRREGRFAPSYAVSRGAFRWRCMCPGRVSSNRPPQRPTSPGACMSIAPVRCPGSPVTMLVWYEAYSRIIDARIREYAIERWRRAWTFALIDAFNPAWRDRYEDLGFRAAARRVPCWVPDQVPLRCTCPGKGRDRINRDALSRAHTAPEDYDPGPRMGPAGSRLFSTALHVILTMEGGAIADGCAR